MKKGKKCTRRCEPYFRSSLTNSSANLVCWRRSTRYVYDLLDVQKALYKCKHSWIPLSLSKAHLTKGDLQSLNELFLASEGMVVCKFRPPAVVTLSRSFYWFNMEFPKCDAGSEKNMFLLLGLPVSHFHFHMFSLETPQRNQLSQTNGTMTVNMEQAQTTMKAANNSPEYTTFCTCEDRTRRLVTAKWSFDLP